MRGVCVPPPGYIFCKAISQFLFFLNWFSKSSQERGHRAREEKKEDRKKKKKI